jgi:hypothetical protein
MPQKAKMKIYDGSKWVEYVFPVSDHSHGYIQDLSIDGSKLKYTKGDGSSGELTIPDNNTTYTIRRQGASLILTGSDGSTSSAQAGVNITYEDERENFKIVNY